MSWLKWILQWIYAAVIGCIHRHTTWPHRNRAGFDYVCCLDCGAELPYSVQQMRIVTQEELLQESNQEVGEQVGRIRREPVLVFSRKDSSSTRARAARVGDAA